MLAALVACGAPAEPPPITNVAPKTAPVQSPSDELVGMLLTDFITNPKTMPDAGLLPKTGPIELVIDIEHSSPPAFDHLPRGPRPFVVTTIADLQREADAANKDVAYIHISISFAKDGSASVSRGGDIVLPKSSKAIKMCCCTSSQHFDRTATGWKGSETMTMICG